VVPAFEVVSPFRPAGDQPQAIDALVAGIGRGDRYQTLLGITGSGKTATIAWTIEGVQRPTLVIEPNKSLAAQLAAELKGFFPRNRVEYFVSYYDYYQPEAYVPSSDTYIEKDSSINDEIDRLRHATTSSLLLRPDTIVVASVSCIYGLGSPDEYRDRIVVLRPGETHEQRHLLRRLVELQYSRNDVTLTRGQFRARGDTVEIHPAYEERAVRVEFFGDTVERIRPFDVLTGEIGDDVDELVVFAKTHYGTGDEKLRRAVTGIETELGSRLKELDAAGKLLEAQRLRMRTEYDLEMLAETGVCSGVENYSRHLDGREPGEAPFTLLDFFPDDFLVVLDESHVAIPQLRGQFAGDRSRKETLVDHGFRLPSALDNRPLRFEEFLERTGQVVMLSATPGPWEREHSTQVVEQVIRPTGLVDPEVVVHETRGQVDDLLARIGDEVAKGGRVLVTTLTKKMAEDLTDFLADAGVRVRQPLARALVHLPPGASSFLEDMVADELNVDAVEVTSDLGDVLAYELVPNFKLLGPRLGPRVQALRSALAGLDAAAVAAELAGGHTVTVDVAGDRVELGPEELELRVQGQGGFAVSRDGAEVVALDLTLDDDLVTRGLAREVVRHVQDARKAAGFSVSDAIHLRLDGLDRVAPLREAIGREVLADSVAFGSPGVSGTTGDADSDPDPDRGTPLDVEDGTGAVHHARMWITRA